MYPVYVRGTPLIPAFFTILIHESDHKTYLERMKIFLFIVAFIPAVLRAETVVIHEMKPHLLKLEDGRVVYFSESPDAPVMYPRGTKIDIELDTNHNILSFKVSSEKSLYRLPINPSHRSIEFEPTVYSTYSRAQNALNVFRFPDAPGSQCYDRAHIWTYEAEKFSAFRLSKMWLFFSDHYIESNSFKWWFHVAPVAQVNMKGSVENRIMDRGFSKFPLKIKIWTDLFMIQKQDCRVVSKYTDYSEHPNEDDCYLIESTPYYWQPRDLERLAKRSINKTQYIDGEVSHAYKQGFGIP